MEDAQASLEAATYAGNALAQPRSSQLERFANEIAKQNELLSVMESRLDTVSNRSPQKADVPKETERVHISTLVNLLAHNNSKLSRLIDEIDL